MLQEKKGIFFKCCSSIILKIFILRNVNFFSWIKKHHFEFFNLLYISYMLRQTEVITFYVLFLVINIWLPVKGTFSE